MQLALSGHFLAGSAGPLATILIEPPPDTPARFSVLYLPPFGDEMNKSRRTVALAARCLAKLGARVALLDPRGTGDSAGEHGAATWDGWQQDAVVASRWLTKRSAGPHVLWGLRLGALLAAKLVNEHAIEPAVLLLWQPVASGRAFFQQFLRLSSMQDVAAGSGSSPSVQSLRATLESGVPIEVAGYDLNPQLVAGAEHCELGQLVPTCPIIWREASIASPPALSSIAATLPNQWRDSGADVDVRAVAGPSFWASVEIAEAPELIASTGDALIARLFAQPVVAS